ncbi:MAG: oligosaccharide flippase family protein [Acidobacteriota bacterium]
MTATAEPQTKSWSTSAIVRNVTSNWAGIVVSVGFAFVLAPLTVRTLGTVHYGIWTLLMQLTGYLWLFDFGVRESVIKYVSQYHAADDQASIVSTVRTAVSIYTLVSLATLLAAIALALALPYLFNIPPHEVMTARLTALLVGATVAQSFVFNVFVGVVMGLQKFYLISRLGIIFTIARGAATYVLLTAGFGIVTLAFVQFATTLISNLLVYRLAHRELPYLTVRLIRPSREEAMTLFNYGKYVLISNVGDKLVFATDSIVIGIFQPISALTYYAIGGTLIEQLRTFVNAMATIFNPLISTLDARKETSALPVVVLAGAKAAMLLGLPLCIGFVFVGTKFIELWMGPELAGTSGMVLAVLAVGHGLGLPYYTISGVLYGLGRHRIVAWSRIFEGVVNLALSVFLVQRYGVVGVAIGTIIPHIIVVAGILPNALPRWIALSVRDYYFSTYVWPLLAAAPFAAACWYIAHMVAPASFLTFFLCMTAAMPLYFVPTWFLALSAPERAAARDYVRHRFGGRRVVEATS